MPSDMVAGRRARGEGSKRLRTDRLESLSDGVFAFSMTLLVLDIAVPLGVPRSVEVHSRPMARLPGLLRQLLHDRSDLAGAHRDHGVPEPGQRDPGPFEPAPAASGPCLK